MTTPYEQLLSRRGGIPAHRAITLSINVANRNAIGAWLPPTPSTS